MRLERPFILSFDDLSGRFEGSIDVTGRLVDLAFHHIVIANFVVDFGLRRKWWLCVRPLHLERLAGFDGVPLLRSNHSQEALFTYDLDAWNVRYGSLVNAHRHGARYRRPHHPAMQHAWDFYIGDEILLAVHNWCNVTAGDRLTDHLVVRGLLREGLAGSIERVAKLLVPIQLDIKVSPADEVCI